VVEREFTPPTLFLVNTQNFLGGGHLWGSQNLGEVCSPVTRARSWLLSDRSLWSSPVLCTRLLWAVALLRAFCLCASVPDFPDPDPWTRYPFRASCSLILAPARAGPGPVPGRARPWHGPAPGPWPGTVSRARGPGPGPGPGPGARSRARGPGPGTRAPEKLNPPKTRQMVLGPLKKWWENPKIVEVKKGQSTKGLDPLYAQSAKPTNLFGLEMEKSLPRLSPPKEIFLALKRLK